MAVAATSTGSIVFRRQHPIGPYVLDFYCASRKLAIEVDGMAHDRGDRPQRDERRTRWLEEQGVEVMRIPARDVLADPDSVAEGLIRLCAQPLHPSLRERSPSPLVLRKSGEDHEPP